MEIPEINMISDFEAGMKCLQNPSLISRFSSFPEKVPRVYSFWKWGALIFAIFATFSSIIRRIKLIFIRFHAVNKPSSSHKHEEIIEFSDDDDISLASSDDEQDDGDQNRPTTASFRGHQHRVDEEFSVKGSFLSFRSQWQNGHQLRRRSSSGAWSEFAPGKNVVKLWDSLGLSLDFDEDLFSLDSKSVVSTWDLDQDQQTGELSRGFWNTPATAPMASAAAVLAAEGNGKGGGVVFGAYDTRMRSGLPALFAEWSSPAERVASVSAGGVGKVYVMDDVSGVVTVGDVRNVRRPLERVRESDGETWWDADAVIVENEFEQTG